MPKVTIEMEGVSNLPVFNVNVSFELVTAGGGDGERGKPGFDISNEQICF